MDLDDLRAFLAVAETGSVLAAAEQLKVARTTLRRRIDALETRTGAILLYRGTQGSGLTEAGAFLAQRGRRILQEAGGMLTELRSLGASPAGVLRVVLPVGLPPHLVATIYAATRAANPGLTYDARHVEDPLALLGEDVDLALHFGDRIQSGPWITRRLLPMREQLVASPEYLARCGRPSTPAELADHTVFVWRRPGADPRVVPVVSGDVRIEPAAVSSDIHILRQLALAGAGIALVPDGGFPDPEGVVEPILVDQVGRDCPLRYVAPEAMADAPRIRAVLDGLEPFLVDE